MRIDFQPAQLVPRGEFAGASRPSNNLPTSPEKSALVPSKPIAPASPEQITGGEFSQVLGKELARVNGLLAEADVQAQKVATGEAENLHEAMLAMAEADLALQVTMRVTQKAIAAYQEISRMQI